MSANTKILGLMLVTAVAMSSPMMVWADDTTTPTIPAATDASHKDGGWHHGHGDHMMDKILGLSDDQKKQLKDLHQKQKDAMKATFEQIKTNREAFDAEIVKATPDMAKLTDLETQMKTIQGQMTDARLSSMLEIKKIMTPEQFIGYMALEKEKEMKMHMMGHHKFGSKDGHGDKGWGKQDSGHSGDDQD